MGSSDSPTSIPDTQKDETQPPNTPDPQMPRNIVSPDTTDSLPRTPDSGLKGQTIIDTVHGLENHDSNSATPDSIISSEPVMPNCEHATDHENSESPTTFNIFINADQDENESVGQPSNEISNDAEQDSTKQTSISNSNLTDKPRGFSSLSTATLGSVNANLVSVVFVKKALENINKSKEAKKNIPLQTSSKKALEQLAKGILPPPTVIYEPLQLACQTNSNQLKVIALDCISKLFSSFYYFELSEDHSIENSEESFPPKVDVIDKVIDAVSTCFTGEGCDEHVELQVVKALMAGVLNETVICHGATLLKAIRQIYNVFILSFSIENQITAQASLSQIINTVFDRVKTISNRKDGHFPHASTGMYSASELSFAHYPAKSESSINISSEANGKGKMTLRNFEDIKEIDEEKINVENEEEEDLCVKDAFLVFRTMCKLSIKALDNEVWDMKSHSMRSKLLSLHMVHTILKTHMSVFISPKVVIKSLLAKDETLFSEAINQYLCLALSRNATSSIPPIFELSIEIFWLVVSNMRGQFKREIEVFFREIYFPIAEMKTSTAHQKQYLLSVIRRLCYDPRALVEIYLNYDCDKSTENILERIIGILTKQATTYVRMTHTQEANYLESLKRPLSTYNPSSLPSVAITHATHAIAQYHSDLFPVEYSLKIESLQCLVDILRSLYSWSQKRVTVETPNTLPDTIPQSSNGKAHAHNNRSNLSLSAHVYSYSNVSLHESTLSVDDPTQFESVKLRKNALSEGLKQFNFNPKKGIEFLIERGFINSDKPFDIAKFLLTAEGLDKAVIGEYLGGKQEKNVAIMHALADMMEFSSMTFVDALRKFLQPFRLPGESQQIDRFMLKFAERFVSGNPDVFANADTAYVLAYSVIMLNTDQHSPQVKNRMTQEEFIKNNRGINDNQDLPKQLLIDIFEDIQSNEIKLQSEQQAAIVSGDPHPSNNSTTKFLPFSSRDIQKEAYMMASREMSSKTEKLVRSFSRRSRAEKTADKTVFYYASHIEHVKSIFESQWMSFLAGVTSSFQDYDSQDVVITSLEGVKNSIRIACFFDIELARTSFVGTLARFTSLTKFSEIRGKNIKAIIMLLDIAQSEGNYLKSSWYDVLICVSQLERFQLISSGIEAGVIPDLTNAKIASPDKDPSVSPTSNPFSFNYIFGPKARSNSTSTYYSQQVMGQNFDPEISEAVKQTDIVVAMDKIFTESSKLSGDAIVDFVKGLTKVSSDEIDSSDPKTENPRMFSLQKMVYICYYNMDRIRVQWSNLWAVMGEQFNQACCNPNKNVFFFALDSLRQLSVRFFEIGELPHFKFQKEFLGPFQYVMIHNSSQSAKELVLECLSNMLLTKASSIKSGWKTLLGALAVGAKDANEVIVRNSFDLVYNIYDKYAKEVYSQDYFTDLVHCFAELTKNKNFPKLSLHSLETLHGMVTKFGDLDLQLTGGTGETEPTDTPPLNLEEEAFNKLWLPVLTGLRDVLMTADDLEVRSRALKYLFDILTQYGSAFEFAFWKQICEKILFEMLSVLKSKEGENKQFSNPDDLSIWLSTTLIQATKNIIKLFGYYFDILGQMLDGFLDLIIICICQENDTIARVGRACFQQMIIESMSRFDDNQWNRVISCFETLFDNTSPYELFLKNTEDIDSTVPEGIKDKKLGDKEIEDENEKELRRDIYQDGSLSTDTDTISHKISHNVIIVKCVLQLLMIETVGELISDLKFYSLVPMEELLRLSGYLEKSFIFAQRFNEDRELRIRLWQQGFMKQLPNLLKQETTAAAVYIKLMFKIYSDPNRTLTTEYQDLIQTHLIPLCVDVVNKYVGLDDSTIENKKHLSTWRPVLSEMLKGYSLLATEDFAYNATIIYDLLLRVLDKKISNDLQIAIKYFLVRTRDVFIKDKEAVEA